MSNVSDFKQRSTRVIQGIINNLDRIMIEIHNVDEEDKNALLNYSYAMFGLVTAEGFYIEYIKQWDIDLKEKKVKPGYDMNESVKKAMMKVMENLEEAQ